MAKSIEIAGRQQSAGLCGRIAAGNVLRSIPRQTVDEALTNCSVSRVNRRDREFSDHLVVYYVILMCLFFESSYNQVFHELRKALDWLASGFSEDKALSDSAITQARQRISFEPLETLFHMVSREALKTESPGACFAGYRLTALDGTTLDVRDTPENAVFGRKTVADKPGAFPQLRLVALMDFYSRTVIDAVLAGMQGSDEITLAKLLNWERNRKCLVLADRYFAGTPLCKQIRATDSHFLFRVKSTLKLTPIEVFPDHSYTAQLRQNVEEPFLVRVVEYQLEGSDEVYRLVTSLGVEQATPAELATLYHRRWTAETIYGEIKSSLRSQSIVLRSKSPKLVAQEVWGFLLAHHIVRVFMLEAAEAVGVTPKDISYQGTVKILKRSLPNFGSFPP